MKKLIIFVFLCSINAQVYIVKDKIFLQKPLKSWIEFKNDNLIRQHYDYSCGSASLGTILKYYYNDEQIDERKIIDGILKSKGYDTSQNEVLKEGDNIISFLDLSEFAKTRGFKAIGLAVDFEGLSELKIPAIIYVNVRNIGHFTVYKGKDKDYIYLSDPSFGNIKMRINQFKKMFYQRDDSKYPGKILVILPQDKNLITNKNFMNITNNSNNIYEVIKKDLIHQRLYR